jgi:uncharacterized protein
MRSVLLHHQLWWLALLMLIIFVAGFFQSAAGFGFALFAVPVGAMIVTPRDVVVSVFLTSCVISLVLTQTQREHIVWSEAKRLSIGAVVAMPLGVWLLQSGSASMLRLILGISTTAAALWSLLMANRLRRPWADSSLLGGFVGAVSGVLNTSLATNGPPLVIYLQGRQLAPEQFRATISLVFSVSNGIGLVMLLGGDAIRMVDIELFGSTLLAAAAGTALGFRQSAKINKQHFGLVVNILLLSGGLTSLARALFT